MMNKERIEELIDLYVLGSLSDSDKAELDAIIEADPKIKKELIMRKDISRSINYVNDKRLRGVLDEIHGEEFGTQPGKNNIKLMRNIILGVAAVFAIFFIVNILTATKDVDTDSLFAQNYKPYITSEETRNTQNILDNEAFLLAYNNKEYEKALEIIKPSLENPPSDILLLAAISAIEVGEWNKSMELLDLIIEEDNYYFRDHAKWYKALVLLKSENIDDCKSLLKELKNDPKADHHDEAIKLLENL